MNTKPIIVTLAVAGFFSTGCTNTEGKPKTEQKETVPAAAAAASASAAPATFVLGSGSIHTELKIPSELTAYREVDLYAKVNSYVRTLTVDVGSAVKEGQILATLDAPELVSQLAAAESKYKSQQAIYESSNATYQRVLDASRTPGTISKNDVDIAVAKRNSDMAQMEAALADYKASNTMTGYLTIHAPFDGIISTRNVNLGAYTGPAGKGSVLPIFTLQQQRYLRLVIEIPEAYKSFIKLNSEVSFTVKAYPDQIFSGRIVRRAGVMDKTLRSEHIELDVRNDDLKLSPGMVAEAVIGMDSEPNTFVVPRGAVVNSTEGVFMIGVVKGVIQRVPVRVGRLTDTQAEVFGANLAAGATFVTKGSEEIKNGDPLH
ncbi:MAG TPA: efflux RND transporter periplasmic adaptor subunit [Puia sp.]|jgi:RND family efflux transporter MFP subunit